MFDESKHPRDKYGKFTYKNGYDSRDNFGNLIKKAQRNNYERVSMPTLVIKLPDIDEEEIEEDKKRVAEFIEKKRRGEKTQRKLMVTKVTDKVKKSS